MRDGQISLCGTSGPKWQLSAIIASYYLNLQAGNNLLIVQSPGQPAVVQQVQVVQPKQESQVVQIPQQALKVVQAASATLPPVPQKQTAPQSLQVTQAEPTQVSVEKPINYSIAKLFCFYIVSAEQAVT